VPPTRHGWPEDAAMGLGSIADAIGGALGGGSETTTDGVAHGVQRKIKVDGALLKEDVAGMIESVVVQDRLRMPSSFAITFRDPTRDVLARGKLKVGATVKIEVGAPGVETTDELIEGEITSIEADYDRLGTRAIVRGYDKLHRLAAGTNSKTWKNTKYSDIAKELASNAGLSPSVDTTSEVLDHVIQPNVSDLHFLYYLAGRCGFVVSVKDGKLLFKAPPEAGTGPGPGEADSKNPLQLVWGQRLIEFRARISAVGQVDTIEVRGWNPVNQQVLIGRHTGGTKSTDVKTKVYKLTDTSKGDTYTVVDQPIPTQSHAEDLAEAIAEQIGSAAYEATALVVGSPKLKSGVAVNISKVDPELAGKWVITSARHEFGNGPYRTFLEFSGRQDRSLLGLAGGGSTESKRPELPGVVTALVTQTHGDGHRPGTVKVKYDWLGKNMESGWARVAGLGAGAKAGVLWMPDKGDEVIVAFEHGDINYPVVIGSLWSKANMPPPDLEDRDKDGLYETHGLVTKEKHAILLRDQDSDAKVKQGIEIFTGDEKIKVVLDQEGQKLELFLDGKELTITSKGDLKLSADGEISMESQKKVSIKGQSGVDIAASGGNTTIKGTKVAIN
jgi:phage protein D/phage baseplate assembly protein gpV